MSKNTITKPKIKTLTVSDKYSIEHLKGVKGYYDDKYPDPIYEKADKIIHKIVYDTINEHITVDKIETIEHLTKINTNNITKYDLITVKIATEIYDRIKKSYPTIISNINNTQLEFAIIHHISRFLYDFLYMLSEYNPELFNKNWIRRVRRKFIIHNIVGNSLRVYKLARSFLYQQISHYLHFNERVNRKIINFLHKYTQLNEETIIQKCLNDICGMVIYKINFLKSKDLGAVLKSIIRISMSYIFSIKTSVAKYTEEDDVLYSTIDNVDYEYKLFLDASEIFEDVTDNSYVFLLTLLQSAYKSELNYKLNKTPIYKKYMLEEIKNTYMLYNLTSPNIFLCIYYITINKLHTLSTVYTRMNDSSYDLYNFFIDDEINLAAKQKYPELYRFMKAIPIRVKNKSKINKKQLQHVLENEFEFNTSFDGSLIKLLSEQLSNLTTKIFNNNTYIYPISKDVITILDKNQLYKDIARLYLDFMNYNK